MPTALDELNSSPRTAAQLHGLIEKIDLLVLQVLDDEDPDAGASFRIGDRSVNRTEYLAWLLKARQEFVKELSRLPAWETTTLVPRARGAS